jgi:phosphoglycerate dehydrogenase-like enzyme
VCAAPCPGRDGCVERRCQTAAVPTGPAPEPEPPAGEPCDIVVLCDYAGSVARIRERFPTVEVIDITGGLAPGTRGDVLFGGWSPNSVAAVASGVRWVQLMGTGIDRVPPEVRAVPLLTTARGASAVAISEYVIAAMGACARNFPENWLRESPEHWNVQPARLLAGDTVALFGFGGIAQRVARIALALEMSVVALRRTERPAIDGVTLVHSIQDLVSVADHLVLAAPATDVTRYVINAETLALMKPGAHLVNIARGALVDQEALRPALDGGTIGRASLDVTEPEPLPPGHWMYDHPKVFLTPHSSWVGPPPFAASTELFCDNLQRFLAGEPLEGVVGPDGY